jgi:probable HAF family extracellular repeat protein
VTSLVYTVDWFKVAGGGGTSTGDVYTVTGTFGQQDAGGPMQGGGYSVEGGFWSLLAEQSSSVTGTVPAITTEPQSLFVTNGATISFNVSASGTPALFYQWQKDGINLTDGGNAFGSTNASLTLDTALFSVAGSYSVIVENAYGSVTSSVVKLTLVLPTYSVTDLGTLGGTYSYGLSINNSGQVAGYSTTAGNAVDHAFLYSGGTMTDLHTLGGTISIAFGINNNGQVVGYSDTVGNVAAHAFLYSGGTMTDLGTLDSGTFSEAIGINNSGQIVGDSATDGNMADHAFLYSGQTMNDLDTLGGDFSQANGINNSGQVVGYSDISENGSDHAFLYSGQKMNDLDTLGGDFSLANGINNSGQVVGYFETVGNAADHAFLYSGGSMVDLGTLGGNFSEALGINNSGQIVGESVTSGNGAEHAFLYRGGTMLDLNNLTGTNTTGIFFYAANGINDSGQIIANANNNHAYLLTLITPGAYLAENLTPKIQSSNVSNGSFQFSWNTVNTYPAVGYQVQTATNLTSANWINLGGVLPGTTSTLSATNTIGTDAQRFYRVLLVQ